MKAVNSTPQSLVLKRNVVARASIMRTHHRATTAQCDVHRYALSVSRIQAGHEAVISPALLPPALLLFAVVLHVRLLSGALSLVLSLPVCLPLLLSFAQLDQLLLRLPFNVLVLIHPGPSAVSRCDLTITPGIPLDPLYPSTHAALRPSSWIHPIGHALPSALASVQFPTFTHTVYLLYISPRWIHVLGHSSVTEN
jgi:hypothetical protein